VSKSPLSDPVGNGASLSRARLGEVGLSGGARSLKEKEMDHLNYEPDRSVAPLCRSRRDYVTLVTTTSKAPPSSGSPLRRRLLATTPSKRRQGPRQRTEQEKRSRETECLMTSLLPARRSKMRWEGTLTGWMKTTLCWGWGVIWATINRSGLPLGRAISLMVTFLGRKQLGHADRPVDRRVRCFNDSRNSTFL